MTSPTNADAAAAPSAQVDPRRQAHRDMWDARLKAVLTADFQAAATLAKLVDAKKATVLERLNDMRKRGLVERKLVKAPPPKKKAKRFVHHGITEAQFRLTP